LPPMVCPCRSESVLVRAVVVGFMHICKIQEKKICRLVVCVLGGDGGACRLSDGVQHRLKFRHIRYTSFYGRTGHDSFVWRRDHVLAAGWLNCQYGVWIRETRGMWEREESPQVTFLQPCVSRSHLAQRMLLTVGNGWGTSIASTTLVVAGSFNREVLLCFRR